MPSLGRFFAKVFGAAPAPARPKLALAAASAALARNVLRGSFIINQSEIVVGRMISHAVGCWKANFKQEGVAAKLILWLYHNGGADRDQAQQILCVPICQAETAVGLGAANIFRTGGAMDAIA